MLRLALATVLAAVVFFAALGAASGGGFAAQLRITGVAPLTISGRGFAARERVRLAANAGGRTARRVVVATARGTFTWRPALSWRKCEPLRVSAIGSRGSRASFDLRPLDCLEPTRAAS